MRLHLSEQYLTSLQTFAHFLRQVKGRPHIAHILVGRSDFLMPFGISQVAFFHIV